MPEQPPSETPAPAPPLAGHKLRPSAVPIWFLYDAGRAILGLIPLLVLGGLSPVPVVVGLLLLISPAVKYSRFRYDIQDNTLIVQGGLLSRWRRVIPRERVQSIDVVQKLRHRAFGVVELRIEAVGGKQTEAALVALLPEEAARIRRWASGGAAAGTEAGAPPEDDSPPLARLTSRDLLMAGMTGGRVAVLAALLGYAQELIGEDSFATVSGFAERLLPGASLVLVISLVASVVLILSLALSIALTVVIYWDFTVRLQDGRLVITRGLLEHRRAQIPLKRLQAIQVDENLIRRPLGLAGLTVVVAGYSSESQENTESSMLLPIGRREDAWRLANRILGAGDLGPSVLDRPPARSAFRRAFAPTAAGLALGTAGWAILGAAGALGFLLVPASWLGAWLSWRCSGHGLVPGFAVVRSGVLVRRTTIVPVPNIQHLQLTWTAFQQSLELATVRLHIPGTSRRASDLEAGEARHWFRRLSEAALPERS